MDLNITSMCKHSRPYFIQMDNKFSQSCQCAETPPESPKFIVFPYNVILLKKCMSMALPLVMMLKGSAGHGYIPCDREATQVADIDQF